MKKAFSALAAVCAALYAFSPAFSGEITRRQVLAAREMGERGIPVLKQALSAEDLIVRRTAVRVLADIGEPAVEVLSEALENPDDQVRRMALLALDEMGKIGVSHLIKAASDESEAVRTAAAEMLDVLKLWNFLPDAKDEPLPAFDIHGETKLVEGPQGIALEVPYFPFVRGEPGPERQGGEVANSPLLFPEGPFSLEAWCSPTRDLNTRLTQDGHDRATLFDVMGVSYVHQDPRVESKHGYKMYLLRYRGDREHEGIETKARIRVELGFGREEDLAAYTSGLQDFEPGKWYHIVFTYDGEGRGKIYVNGEMAAEGEHEGRKGVLPGRRGLGVGERSSSTYEAFPGKVGPVRLYNRVVELE